MEDNYGLLINKDIKLHRTYFKQLVKLQGIFCNYFAPRTTKTYDQNGELDSKYYEPMKVGVIFNEHPDQKSLKKMGWVAELQEGSSIIHVPYDLPHLEVGAIFEIPSGLDDAKPRRFRVISMSNIMIYPASIACEIGLEYESAFDRSELDYSHSSAHLLVDNKDERIGLK